MRTDQSRTLAANDGRGYCWGAARRRAFSLLRWSPLACQLPQALAPTGCDWKNAMPTNRCWSPFDATSLRRRAMRLICGLTKGCLLQLLHGANGLMGEAQPCRFISASCHQAVGRVGDALHSEFRNSPCRSRPKAESRSDLRCLTVGCFMPAAMQDCLPTRTRLSVRVSSLSRRTHVAIPVLNGPCGGSRVGPGTAVGQTTGLSARWMRLTWIATGTSWLLADTFGEGFSWDHAPWFSAGRASRCRQLEKHHEGHSPQGHFYGDFEV